MQNILKIISAIAVIAGISTYAIGQSELSTGNLGHLWQSNRFNPAYIQPNKVTVALGNTFVNASASGFTPKDVYRIENETLYLQAADAFSDKNELRLNAEVVPLALEFKIGNNTSIGLDYGVFGEGNLYFNEGISDLLLNGNAAYFDEDKRVEANIHMNGFTSAGLRFATRLQKWQIGAKLKYIRGIVNLNTAPDKNYVDINTASGAYSITGTTNYELFYSDAFTITGDSIAFDDIEFGGSGFGLDLGLQYNLSDKWILGFAVTNLGGISFDDMKKSTSSGRATYYGENVDDINADDIDLGASVETFLDTFDFVESRGSYTYNLPTRLFINGQFQAMERLMLSGALVGEWYNETSAFGLSVGANYDIIPRYINVGLSLGSRNGSFSNLGFNATLAVLPFEIFFVTDNILGIAGIANVNARMGINLRFGNKKAKHQIENNGILSN